jgi:endonuclease/exonuclease/phosphatase family metal-dependent hydrolase
MFIKKILSFSICVLFLLPAMGQPVTLLTYNIRYDNPGDGPDRWALRKAWLCSQIRQAGPDIFGIQEGLAHQVSYIDSTLDEYRYIGVGREDGKQKGEFCAIYYQANKYKVLKKSTFWLSATPGKVSVGWDAALERICTYGLFREILTGRKFWVFNTHFDHIGVKAREESARLVLQKINALNKAGYPVVLMGDFNSGPGSEAISLITGSLRDSKIADKSMSMMPDGTFNGFDASRPATERIDYIFSGGKNTEVLDYAVIRELKEGRYASDHFAVIARINITKVP